MTTTQQHSRGCCPVSPLVSSLSAPAGYESCSPRVLRILERLVALRDITPDYTYYGIASPWLQVCSGFGQLAHTTNCSPNMQW